MNRKTTKIAMVLTAVLVLVLAACAKISEVTVDPVEAVAVKGGTLQFTATVTGEGNPKQTVTWKIIESVSPATFISGEGLLTVAEDEPAVTLTVRAVSTANRSKYGTSAVALGLNPEYFYGKWQNHRTTGTLTIDLSAETWRGKYNTRGSYTLSDLKWMPALNDDPVTKADYPEGYFITGTATQVYYITGLTKGQQETFIVFPSKDKMKILRKVNNGDDYIFTKAE